MALLAIAELTGSVPRWLPMLLVAPAAFFALLHFLHALIRLIWAMATYRKFLPRLIRRKYGLFRKLARCRAETTKAIVHIVLLTMALAMFFGLGTNFSLLLAALFTGTLATILLRELLPPGGVYLASSSPGRIAFFGQLSMRTIPAIAALLEVSNLLDPKDGGRLFYRRAVGVQNDYRTKNPDDWTGVVRELMEMTAVIVVDGRDDTPGLEFEVKRILKNRVEFKTVFISAAGEMPILLRRLAAKSSHPSGSFFLLSPDDALKVIPSHIFGARKFWIPTRIEE